MELHTGWLQNKLKLTEEDTNRVSIQIATELLMKCAYDTVLYVLD
jgi:hypothetical protein